MVDFCTLVKSADYNVPFSREIWIYNHGTRLVNPKDVEDVRLYDKYTDYVLAKMLITFNGTEFEEPVWFEDEKCVIPNQFIKKNIKLVKYV